jgi:hypothetical protein
MRRRVVKAEIKRPVSGTADELDSLLGQEIGQVAWALDRRQILPEIGTFEVFGSVSEVVRGTAQNPEELLIAMTIGAKLRLPTQVPLANESRLITVGFQQ